MNTVQLDAFDIIGIYVKTCNTDGSAAMDIPALWSRFFAENSMDKITNKTSEDIYAIYTEYEGDFTQPYTTIIGCKVASTLEIPEGMIACRIPAENYAKIEATGMVNEGFVYKAWERIWQSELPRAYVADFEVYGPGSQNPAHAMVDIYIGLK